MGSGCTGLLQIFRGIYCKNRKDLRQKTRKTFFCLFFLFFTNCKICYFASWLKYASMHVLLSNFVWTTEQSSPLSCNPSYTLEHRVSIQLERKMVGGNASSVKLNLTDPCCTLYSLQYHVSTGSTTFEGCQAGGLGHLLHYMREYNFESPKQGRKRFNSITKKIHFSYLPIIYLCLGG